MGSVPSTAIVTAIVINITIVIYNYSCVYNILIITAVIVTIIIIPAVLGI